MVRHGGDIYGNKNITLDLSVNINPLGHPPCIDEALARAGKRIMNYPEYYQSSLRDLIGRTEHIDPVNIVCGNGASDIISCLGHVLRGKKVLIPVPSFYGYERAFGHGEILYHYLRDENDYRADESLIRRIEEIKPEVVVIANPNNPTGLSPDEGLIRDLCEAVREQRSTLIVDESFIEVCEGAASFTKYVNNGLRMVIIRSVTKAYAIPGIRLGYAICSHEELAKDIRDACAEWNISVYAEEAGKAIFSDGGREDYLRRSVEKIRALRDKTERAFYEKGIRYIPSRTGFILFQSRLGLYDEMLDNGILIRDCSDMRGLDKGWFRVAVSEGSSSVVFLRLL